MGSKNQFDHDPNIAVIVAFFPRWSHTDGVDSIVILDYRSG
jgi:hypothetical protein